MPPLEQKPEGSEPQTIHDYVVGKQIGQGAYATVRLAVHKPSGKKVGIRSQICGFIPESSIRNSRVCHSIFSISIRVASPSVGI